MDCKRSTVEDVEGNLVITASENGRYQGFGNSMIDTRTGVLYNYNTVQLLKNGKWVWEHYWERDSDESDWIRE